MTRKRSKKGIIRIDLDVNPFLSQILNLVISSLNNRKQIMEKIEQQQQDNKVIEMIKCPNCNTVRNKILSTCPNCNK